MNCEDFAAGPLAGQEDHLPVPRFTLKSNVRILTNTTTSPESFCSGPIVATGHPSLCDSQCGTAVDHFDGPRVIETQKAVGNTGGFLLNVKRLVALPLVLVATASFKLGGA
jgi:hypothetical protein